MISRASDYAIRALTFLAQQEPGSSHLARDIAKALEIPAPFLAKVLQPLAARGLVLSQRGRSGGFKLALPPSEVSLYQIVDAQEQLKKVRECMLGQAECSDERGCPLHTYWRRTSDEYLATLANTTLQNLVDFCRESPESGFPSPIPSNAEGLA